MKVKQDEQYDYKWPFRVKNKVMYLQSGFALISTLVIMSLLIVITLGLLSLSSIETRTSVSLTNIELARANARIALVTAIGQLQSLTGPDTRVTASSRIFDEENVVVTGVWRSWEGTDHDETGMPIIPAYDLKKETGDPAALPEDSDGQGRFLGWLGSTKVDQSVDDLSDFSKTESDGFIKMLGDGSVIDEADMVYVKPTMVDDSKGAIAYWMSGDNMKAMINVDREESPDSPIAWQKRARSNGRADAETFELELIDDENNRHVASTKSLEFVNQEADVKKFHELTAFNRGLLINTATGGWKKDLSLMTEQYDELPDAELPSFTLSPGLEQTFSKAQNDSHPANPLIYPWSKYRRNPNAAGWAQVPPICSWSSLVDYSLQYKNLTSSSASKTEMPVFLAGIGRNSRFGFQDTVRRIPQVARIQWVLSLCSRLDDKGTTETDDDKYVPGVMATPVVTLYNPYNVELTVDSFDLWIRQSGILPLSFKFVAGSINTQSTTLLTIAGGSQGFTIEINEPFTMPPGSNKIFSLNNPTPHDATGANVSISPGYTPQGGFRFYNINSGNEIELDPGDSYGITEVAYASNTGVGEKDTIGTWVETRVNNISLALRMGYDADEIAGGGDGVHDLLYPPLK